MVEVQKSRLWMRNWLAFALKSGQEGSPGETWRKVHLISLIIHNLAGWCFGHWLPMSVAVKMSSQNHVQTFPMSALKWVRTYMKTCFHTLGLTRCMSCFVFQVHWPESWLERTSPARWPLRVGSKDDVASVAKDRCRGLLHESWHKGNTEAHRPGPSTLSAGNQWPEWAPSKWEAAYFSPFLWSMPINRFKRAI